jgi:hypothetical protein
MLSITASRAAIFAAMILWALPARAVTFPAEDLDDLGPRIDGLDVPPPVPRPAPAGHRPPLWIAVEARYGQRRTGERDVGGMVLLGIPLGRFAQSSPKAAPQPPALKPAPSSNGRGADESKAPPDPKLPASRPDARQPELTIPIPMRADVARGAIRAALKRAHLDDPEARLDGLVARAARAALLPELRLRVMRLVDEAENQSPTQYDSQHTTASGGTSLWLEARATWRLDRLVFTEEEIAVERLRYERAEAQERLSTRVLELLFAWQKACALAENPLASPEERLAASLKVLESETTLDVLTDGWFARWRAREALRPPAEAKRSAESDRAR